MWLFDWLRHADIIMLTRIQADIAYPATLTIVLPGNTLSWRGYMSHLIAHVIRSYTMSHLKFGNLHILCCQPVKMAINLHLKLF